LVVAIVVVFFVVASNSPLRVQGKGHRNGNGHEKRGREGGNTMLMAFTLLANLELLEVKSVFKLDA
jgi:hypothetical protein